MSLEIFPLGSVARLYGDLPERLRMYGAVIAVASRPREPSLEPKLPARGRAIVRIADGLPVAGFSVLHVAAQTVQEGGAALMCFPSWSAAESYAKTTLPRLGIHLIDQPSSRPTKGSSAT